jgi:hypothetical protein
LRSGIAEGGPCCKLFGLTDWLNPIDLFEDAAQTASLPRIDHLDKSDATVEVFAKHRMPFPILGFRTMTNAVGEDRFKTVEIGAHHVRVSVYAETGKMLADTLMHDPRLAVMNGEAFLHYDGSGVSGKAVDAALEWLIA